MQSGFTACPGLFYTTPAQDGILSRIRIPGGMINSNQCRVLADIADEYGGGYVDLTNRANVQVREISTNIDHETLKLLQDSGLGSRNTHVDHIRNIMSSPTAGIDPQELIDTSSLVQAWDNYITEHSHLSGLSAKFSVCFDGGGLVRVYDRPNDIAFAAVKVDDSVYFRLYLSLGERGESPTDIGILLKPEECLPVLVALADVYLSHLDTTRRRKPRLREVLSNLGYENYLQEVEQRLPFALQRVNNLECYPTPGAKYGHIDVHPQRQAGLSYIGVVLSLGRLTTLQIRRLADLAERYGSGIIRLTPWQNLLISDIPNEQVPSVQSEIESLGLNWSVTHIRSALVACSGSTGCGSGATDTKNHARTLAEYLEHIKLNQPVNIHFSGCNKSCAQHTKSDIALVGVNMEHEERTVEGYHVYVGDSEEKFGREIYQYVSFAELPRLIERMLKVYKIESLTPNESFGDFANRHATATLKQLFT
ncbi:precorrin-3B synthase [Aetokthonos hydrillicola]|uniref:precorrin-3B synthase n=1 Tax=Aetokthonos hydrillicola TaxID=1550245 RepID=UPI001ABA5EA5|nr:precorrin-3B synthase [Aetokthonos hydrillicola]MBO3459354.1 precorrin-3B synthase [Aetokthonos hydrillicola CCALA 1050]MBW4586500.1 precorrin-3B synthase [Aetokthonos hydrillicola CCALA 1050]